MYAECIYITVMQQRKDLIRIEGLTVEQVPVRDTETGEEKTAWKVNHDDMERPCRGDTLHEALNVFAQAAEEHSGDATIDLEELSE